ncbi:MAG: DUF1127 domain-containing protein [Rhodospirillales bacterium]|nr:MAG: DUF1127 domain-containing protein [Rhodospirillales bacterium]
MLDSIYRGIAHAAGVEVVGDVRIVEKHPAGPSLFARIAAAFESWKRRRSTYLVLQQLDDKTLQDIGLHRGMLLSVADQIGRRTVGNRDARSVSLRELAANDNDPCTAADCA